MQDKKLRISVEDSKLRDLKRAANDMIRSSRQYTTSSKEVIRDLENQIKLIEKRNRLDAEQQKLGLQTRFGAGEITKSQYTSQLQGVRTGSQEDKVQIQLLKEIIDTIQRTSKEEIREDRVTVEKTIRKDKSLNKLGITGDPQQALLRTIQKGILGDLGEEEQMEKAWFRAFGKFGKGAGRAFNTAAQLGTSKNEMYAVAAMLSMIPFAGQGMSNFAGRLFSSAEGVGLSKEKFGVLNRMGIGGVNNLGLIGTARDVGSLYGFNATDVVNRSNAYQGIGMRNVNNIPSLLGAERMLGLSQGDISGIYGATRHSKFAYASGGKTDVEQVIATFNQYLRETKQQQAVLPEVLRTFNMVASQIGQSGYVDQNILSTSIAGISSASGLKGQHLQRFIGGVQGLGGTQNPMTRSLMMRAFRQMNPNASLWDIQTMMESPMEHLGEVSKFMGNIEGMAGGKGGAYKQILYSIFKDSGLNRRDIDLVTGGGKSLRDILSSKTTEGDIYKETQLGAGKYVSEMTKSTKAWDRAFEEYGDKAAQYVSSALSKVKEVVDDVLSTDSQDYKKRKQEEFENMKKAVSDGLDEGLKKYSYYGI